MALKKITRTVLSYCEIPEKITEDNALLQEASCGSYLEYSITPRVEQNKYDDSFELDNWIIDTYPELEGMTILIEIDY